MDIKRGNGGSLFYREKAITVESLVGQKIQEGQVDYVVLTKIRVGEPLGGQTAWFLKYLDGIISFLIIKDTEVGSLYEVLHNCSEEHACTAILDMWALKSPNRANWGAMETILIGWRDREYYRHDILTSSIAYCRQYILVERADQRLAAQDDF